MATLLPRSYRGDFQVSMPSPLLPTLAMNPNELRMVSRMAPT